MDFKEVRQEVILALFSDDELVKSLVLKGGAALELVHELVSRGSIDVDLSIPADLDNEEDTAGFSDGDTMCTIIVSPRDRRLVNPDCQRFGVVTARSSS